MPERRPGQWATWLLHDRHGANPERLRAILQDLVPIRDKVLGNAAVNVGEVVLDVGAGTGMIAFAALDRVGPGGRVIFLDTSQELLDHCRALAQERGCGRTATLSSVRPRTCPASLINPWTS